MFTFEEFSEERNITVTDENGREYALTTNYQHNIGYEAIRVYDFETDEEVMGDLRLQILEEARTQGVI